MAGPPVGSAMPARHSMQTTYRLKGGAQARQTRRGNEPRPQSNISIKNLVQKLLTQNNTYLRKETDLDFEMIGTLGEENGKAVGWDERRLVCLARGLRGISSTVRDGYDQEQEQEQEQEDQDCPRRQRTCSRPPWKQ